MKISAPLEPLKYDHYAKKNSMFRGSQAGFMFFLTQERGGLILRNYVQHREKKVPEQWLYGYKSQRKVEVRSQYGHFRLCSFFLLFLAGVAAALIDSLDTMLLFHV